MQGLHGKKGLPQIFEQVLGWAFPQKHWEPIEIESWCMLLFLCFLCFVIWLCLLCSFDYVWCMAMPLCLWCHIAIGFSWFFSWFLLVLSFYVLRVLGIGWEGGSRWSSGICIWYPIGNVRPIWISVHV